MKVSVIDLGFNSAKLVNYYVNRNNSYKAYDQKKIDVRLGSGFDKQNGLRREAIRRTIDGLKLFKSIIDFHTIGHILPIATSAVRDACNKVEFLREVYFETGLRFKVLSGQEEAFYSYYGTQRYLRGTKNVVYFDLGGGSMEILYSENANIKKAISIPIGTLRITQAYKKSTSQFSKDNYDSMRQYLLNSIPDRTELGIKPQSVLVGGGGTIRAAARCDRELKGVYPLKKAQRYKLNYRSINSISNLLWKLKTEEIIKRTEAINRSRAETIVAGLCIITTLMSKLGFEEVTVSSSGLREGILSSFLALRNLKDDTNNGKMVLPPMLNMLQLS
jgi:exopolyphosphatase/guanosine-5'-triphosphate,3'-diphosphate pyrophosphatase